MFQTCILLGLIGILCGCGGNSTDLANFSNLSSTDRSQIYEVVLKDGKLVFADVTYLSINGQDPDPILLQQLQRRWPMLRPASQMPERKRHYIYLSQLERIDTNTVEIHGGFNNGIDGQINRYRLIRKNGEWTLQETKVEAIS